MRLTRFVSRGKSCRLSVVLHFEALTCEIDEGEFPAGVVNSLLSNGRHPNATWPLNFLVVFEPPASGMPLRPLAGGYTVSKGLLQTARRLGNRSSGRLARQRSITRSRSAGTSALMLRRPFDFIADVGDDHFDRIRAVERRAAGEQRVGNGSEGVNVAAGIEIVEASGLLGRHEERCAGDAAFLREPRGGGLALPA